ncbi:transglycosylase domain-containing protein [Peribacillus glennii]|uniref:PBP1A family penicillin-binding protein n=1 Tax=Peribacillus glennii TaxID=2303991 RepID=A0A372LF81_9BACI|nr:PBP1A family penicillin-binding protein [Peribacillus glennii]RFU64983.1 PBP1A family penicillin-binding protein [Peribacillus glennii]
MAEKYNSRLERRKQMEAKNKKGKKKSGGLFKRIFLFLITIGIIGIIAGGATFAYFISSAPKLDEKLLRDPVSSKIFDEEGKLLTEVGAERDFVAYEDIPKEVEDAVLATEDVRFYDHQGIDFYRLGGAVLANFTQGFGSQGASTLTQQVVKRSYLTADKTMKRKVQEMWLAFQLERKYTKKEIFEMYVNKIFYGERANGIARAAKTYYGKELEDLKLNEVATLVGLPQRPSAYNPYENKELAKKRRDVVLHLMNKHGFISKAEMDKNQDIPITEGLQKRQTKKNMETYDAFIDQVIEEVQAMGDYNVYSDGLEIHTTLDKDAQEYVYKMLNTNELINYPSEKLQAGITLLDTKSGEIRAIGGGRNTKISRGFNYATDAKRQPGSTIKPILDYGPAVEYLNWSTHKLVTDEPYEYSNGTPLKNASNRYYGTMTIREALARSLNIPAVKTIQEVGLDRAREFGSDLGLPLPDEIGEAYAIGGMERGISSMQLAGAYSAFGNGGIYTKPHSVKKIVLRDKTSVKNNVESKAVMKESTAFIISDMLKSVLKEGYGTGTLANIPYLPVAGKTGSTNFSAEDRLKYGIPSEGVPDSWMAGYTTNFTIAVWAGYDPEENKKEYLGKESQKIPKYLFKNLMEYASKDVATADFEMPSSVAQSGSEYYVRGHMPVQVAKSPKKEEKKVSEPASAPAEDEDTEEQTENPGDTTPPGQKKEKDKDKDKDNGNKKGNKDDNDDGNDDGNDNGNDAGNGDDEDNDNGSGGTPPDTGTPGTDPGNGDGDNQQDPGGSDDDSDTGNQPPKTNPGNGNQKKPDAKKDSVTPESSNS